MMSTLYFFFFEKRDLLVVTFILRFSTNAKVALKVN